MIAALIGLGVGLLSAGASQGDASRLFRGAKDAVVTIGTPTGAGTGFITGDGTLLVTAAHIVEGENLSEIQTSLKNLRVVSVHAFDPDRDVAVLKLNKPASRRLALASALPQPGTEIFVIGTPLGFLQQTISEGIVSGIRKTDTGTLLQITAPVSPGSSGSPVLNSAGQVVGMVVGGIQEGQLLNFAAASSEIQRAIASAQKPREDPTPNPPPKPEVSREERIADLVSKLSGSWGDEAARKLADMGAIDALSKCAKGSSGAVRKRAIDGLIRALSDTNSAVRWQAAWALGEFKDPRAVEPLIRALSDSDWDVRWWAAWALGEIKDPRAVEPLENATRDQNGEVRVEAWLSLWKINKDPRAVEPLIRALSDTNSDVRWQAAWALGEIKDPRAVEPLIRALSDSDSYVRWRAAEALGEIKDPRAVEPLENATRDQNGGVRVEAWLSLWKINKDPHAVEPLIRALSDTNSYVRSSAAEALGEIKDKRALGALQRLLGDDDEYVRNAAREAIRKIEGRPPLADNPSALSFGAESASGTTPVAATGDTGKA